MGQPLPVGVCSHTGRQPAIEPIVTLCVIDVNHRRAVRYIPGLPSILERVLTAPGAAGNRGAAAVMTRHRIGAVALAAVVLVSGCASSSARPTSKVSVRPATEEERRSIGRPLVPLLVASGLWRGPEDGCAVALGVATVDRINVGVAPSTTCKFALMITEGALAKLPPDELQAALAHELGHVRLGHFQARAERRQAEREAKQGIESAGTVGGAIATAIPVIGPLLAIGVMSGQAAAETAVQGEYRAYDRTEEAAADRFAVELLRSLPSGAERCRSLLRLFERLERERVGGGWGDWLQTHPAPAKRGEMLEAACAP
jgi:hypothetical protein